MSGETCLRCRKPLAADSPSMMCPGCQAFVGESVETTATRTSIPPTMSSPSSEHTDEAPLEDTLPAVIELEQADTDIGDGAELEATILAR